MTALKSSVEQKIFFSKKQIPCNRYQKISTATFLADPPEIFISKISEDVKKKVIGGFSGNCLRVQKFSHWDMALGCGPGSRKHPPLPQSGLRTYLTVAAYHARILHKHGSRAHSHPCAARGYLLAAVVCSSSRVASLPIVDGHPHPGLTDPGQK